MSQKTYSMDAAIDERIVKLEVFVPDLSRCKHTHWGDWGVNHEFELVEDEPLLVSVDGVIERVTAKYFLVQSTAEAKVRMETPYYFIIAVDSLNAKLTVYLNQQYDYVRGHLAVNTILDTSTSEGVNSN